MVKLEDQMNNKNLETLQKIFEVCSLVHFCEKDQYFALHFFPSHLNQKYIGSGKCEMQKQCPVSDNRFPVIIVSLGS